jgi:hypothetical protein
LQIGRIAGVVTKLSITKKEKLNEYFHQDIVGASFQKKQVINYNEPFILGFLW